MTPEQAQAYVESLGLTPECRDRALAILQGIWQGKPPALAEVLWLRQLPTNAACKLATPQNPPPGGGGAGGGGPIVPPSTSSCDNANIPALLRGDGPLCIAWWAWGTAALLTYFLFFDKN